MSKTDRNYNQIVVLLGWAMINLILLFQHYNNSRLMILIISSVYLVYKIILKNEETNKNSLSFSDVLPYITGVSVCMFFSWFIESLWPFQFFDAEGFDFTNRLNQYFFQYLSSLSKKNFFSFVFFCFVAVLSFIKINPSNNKLLNLLYRYCFMISVSYLLIYPSAVKKDAFLLICGISAIFFVSDAIKQIGSKKDSVSVNKWYYMWCSVFIVFLILDDNFSQNLLTNNFVEKVVFMDALKLINIFVFSIILTIMGIICWIYRNSTFSISDTFLCLVILSILLFIYLQYIFYVGYWWLFSIAFIMLLLYFINRMSVNNEGDEIKQILTYIVYLAAFIFVFIRAHYGHLISSILFVFSLIIVYVLVKRYKKNWKNTAFSSIAVILLMGIWLISHLYETYYNLNHFVNIITLILVFSLIIYIALYNPNIYKFNKELKYSLLIVLMFSALCILMYAKSIGYINIVRNGNVYTITSETGGDIYWLDDYMDTSTNEGNAKTIKEKYHTSFIGEIHLNIDKSGRIRITSIDDEGSIITAIRWVKPYLSISNE